MAILTTIEIQIFKLIINTKNMKTIFTLALAMLLSNFAFSTVYNVDNNPNRPTGYYNLLIVAINAASAGDTIYVYPSNNSYGNITLTKKLHFFGGGYSSASQSFTSYIPSLTFDTTSSPSSNPSGSSFYGFTFDGISFGKQNISNITIAGCKIRGSLTLNTNCSNIFLQGNYFEFGYYHSINVKYNTNVIISNNIFYGNSTYLNNSSAPSVVVNNNMFFTFQYFGNFTNATISNNIFLCNGETNQSSQYNNMYLNNLSYRDATNQYNLPPAGNTGSGNLSNINPNFVSGSLNPFDPSLDYQLNTSSTGNNAGTDGTDIGIYGGTTPFVWGGIFGIPKITQMTITNPVINQSTPINVNVKAKKADL